MLSVQDSIKLQVARRKDTGRNYFHWSLPRQVGATTLLAQMVIECAYRDPKSNILFVCTTGQQSDEIKDALKAASKVSGINFDRVKIISGKSRDTFGFRGFRYDYIFMDTPSFNGEMFAALYPLITQSEFTVHIDTTEG